MTFPFRTKQPTQDAEDLSAVYDAVDDLRAAAELDALFLRTPSEQLDRAIFDLTGETSLPTPFVTDPTLPDPRRTGSRVDRINQSFDDAQRAIRIILQDADRYPVSER